MHVRAALAVAVAAFVAAAPALALPVFATTTPVAPKVVIVVGATESTTASYRTMADSIAAEALKWTPNVVKVYSPNATWATVAAAATGASVFVYLGHGNGFPSPYRSTLDPTTEDGMGLNTTLGLSDSDKQYYGEASVATLRLAPNAIVFLNHLCYAPGAGEPGAPEPTLSVAEQRVDNFASGFIRAGARTVMADDSTGVVEQSIRGIFSTHQPFLNVWRTLSSVHSHEIPFTPIRNPAFEGIVDPETWTTGFDRSIVADPSLQTDDVVAGAALAPDANGPALWSLTGQTTISPNYDGQDDRLALWARLSEPAAWTWTLTDDGGNVVRTQTGSTDLFALSWDGLPGGSPAPAGTYHWTLHATDAANDPPLDVGGDVTVVTLPIPTTAVLSFGSLTGTPTNVASLAYQVVFATDVSGFSASGLALSGSATGCVVGTPTGGPTTWLVTVTGCTDGTVGLALKAGSVLDATSTPGPPVDVAAATVRIDRTKPTQGAPKVGLKPQVTLSGTAMPVVVSWSASDTGSGVASYDVARSLDGAAFKVVASAIATPSWATSVSAGHTWRYEVRSRDKAGNVSAWVAGPTLHPSLVQQTLSSIAWAGSWTTVSNAAFSGGSERQASTAGASLSYTFTGRAIAILASRDPAYGQVKVYIDGAYVVTTETAAAGHLDRAVVFARSLTWGSHTIKLVVVGTAGRPTVAIDAFEVLN